MIRILKILILPAAFISFAACSSDDGFAPAKGGGSGSPVVVRATVGEGGIYTRTNPASSDTTELKRFDQGDKIRIIYNNSYNNRLVADYTLDANGAWQPADAASFLTWQSKRHNNFDGFYPIEAIVPAEGYIMPKEMIVQQDQSTIDGLKASDLMTYYISQQEGIDEPADHTLNMAFQRLTARVVVEIGDYRDQYNAEDNPVTAITVNGCALNCLSEALRFGDIKAYKIPEEGRQRFVALMCGPEPKLARPISLTLKVKSGEGENELTVNGIPYLEAGKSYNLKLAVGKDKAEVLSVTVNPWKDGSEIPGGEVLRRGKTLNSPYLSPDDVGSFVGSDGYIYNDRADAEAFGATPVAMLAYVGSDTGDPNHNHGLAFALKGDGVGEWTLTATDLPGRLEAYRAMLPQLPDGCGEWKVPSAKDLWLIFNAFGGNNTGYTVRDGYGLNYGTFLQHYLTDCGGEDISSVFVSDVYHIPVLGSKWDMQYAFEFKSNNNGTWGGGSSGKLRCIFAF